MSRWLSPLIQPRCSLTQLASPRFKSVQREQLKQIVRRTRCWTRLCSANRKAMAMVMRPLRTTSTPRMRMCWQAFFSAMAPTCRSLVVVIAQTSSCSLVQTRQSKVLLLRTSCNRIVDHTQTDPGVQRGGPRQGTSRTGGVVVKDATMASQTNQTCRMSLHCQHDGRVHKCRCGRLMCLRDHNLARRLVSLFPTSAHNRTRTFVASTHGATESIAARTLCSSAYCLHQWSLGCISATSEDTSSSHATKSPNAMARRAKLGSVVSMRNACSTLSTVLPGPAGPCTGPSGKTKPLHDITAVLSGFAGSDGAWNPGATKLALGRHCCILRSMWMLRTNCSAVLGLRNPGESTARGRLPRDPGPIDVLVPACPA